MIRTVAVLHKLPPVLPVIQIYFPSQLKFLAYRALGLVSPVEKDPALEKKYPRC